MIIYIVAEEAFAIQSNTARTVWYILICRTLLNASNLPVIETLSGPGKERSGLRITFHMSHYPFREPNILVYALAEWNTLCINYQGRKSRFCMHNFPFWTSVIRLSERIYTKLFITYLLIINMAHSVCMAFTAHGQMHGYTFIGACYNLCGTRIIEWS